MPRPRSTPSALPPDLAERTRRILASLDLRAEAVGLGLRIVGPPDAAGWCACYAADRPDGNPSASFNVRTGIYKDHAEHGDGEWCSFFDLAARLDPDRFPNWRAARDHYAASAGLPAGFPGGGGGKKRRRRTSGIVRAAERFVPNAPDFDTRHDWNRNARGNQSRRACRDLEAATGVPSGAFWRLGATVDSAYPRAHAFPMVDDLARIIGYRFRPVGGGDQWSLTGSRPGLFLPADWPFEDSGRFRRVYVGEGQTDTAALLDWGFDVVGRPSAKAGADVLVRFLKLARPREVALMIDNDAAGREGAAALVPRLLPFVPSVRAVAPPAGVKDWRDRYNGGATAADVRAAVKAAPVRSLKVGGAAEGGAE